MLGENLMTGVVQKPLLASGSSSASAKKAEASEGDPGLGTETSSSASSGDDSLAVSPSAVTLNQRTEEENKAGTNNSDEDEIERDKGLKEQADEQLEKIAEEVSKKLDASLAVKFQKDGDTGTDFFQLYERKSGDVIRQFPPEELIDIVRNNQEFKSTLISEKA